MKLQPPSTLMNKKAQALFLVTLLNYLSRARAGSQFGIYVGNSYNTLVNFANNVPDRENFCCFMQCMAMASPAPISCRMAAYFQSQCNSIGQSKFCLVEGYADGIQSLFPGQLCGGAIGNSLTTNVTVGICPSFDAIGNTLSRQSTELGFSWLCCDINNCTIPISGVTVTDTNGMASTNCANDQYALMCFQDDNIWFCTGSIGTNIPNISQ